MAERALRVVDPRDWPVVHEALRARLEDDGAAVFPTTEPADAPLTVPESTALVIQTSGSTGHPKRVALGEAALRTSAAGTQAALGGRGQWLLCLSPVFVAGSQVLVRSILAGTRPVAGPLGRFGASAFARAVDAMTGVRRYTAVVPAQLSRLVEAGESDRGLRDTVAGLDAILVGGQAVPASLAARAREIGCRIVRTYGSSETATGCVYDGYPVGDTRMRVVDGLLELTGATLADGYLGDPDRTAAAFVVDEGVRWYRTGDRAELADDGRLQVLGRADDVLISGGVKVSLGQVESVVRELPGFADAVVVRAPSAQWGEVPVVYVSGGAAASDRLDEVRHRVGEVLGVSARPSQIIVVDAVPLLASGKPDRQSLAAAFPLP